MDNKPIVPKKVMLEKIYLRCSQGGFWFRTRNHAADTEYVLANKQMDAGIRHRINKLIAFLYTDDETYSAGDDLQEILKELENDQSK